MKAMVVRYTTKPESTEENQRLVKRVFEELRAEQPEGLRYMSLKLDDDTFLHFVTVEEGARKALSDFEAFRSFQAGIRERCNDPPHPAAAVIVGNYRMLSE